MREITAYFWKYPGVDPMYCEEDDEGILHIKEHSFKKVSFDVQDKTSKTKARLLGIYCCSDCGMHVSFPIGTHRTKDIFGGSDITVYRGEIMPFKNGEAFKEYIEGSTHADMFCDFITCDEHKIKDILE